MIESSGYKPLHLQPLQWSVMDSTQWNMARRSTTHPTASHFTQHTPQPQIPNMFSSQPVELVVTYPAMSTCSYAVPAENVEENNALNQLNL